MEESFYGREIAARAYVTYTDATETTHTVYVDNAQTRSAAYVASAALAADESDDEGVLTAMVDAVVGELTATETNLSVKVNKTVTPVIEGNNGLVIKYVSANPEIARVENGVITGVAEGSTTVTASVGSASVTLNVEVSVTELTSEKTAYDLIYNSTDETQATLAVNCDGVPVENGAITWESDAPTVVSVENGVVTALANGTATVTAKYDGAELAFTVTSWQGIYNAADWQGLFAVKANIVGNFKLMNDIAIDSSWSATNEQTLIYDLSVYNLIGKLDGNNHVISNVSSRLFNGVLGTFADSESKVVSEYTQVSDLTVITNKMSVWGGIFGYQVRGAIVDNVTTYIKFGYSFVCNDANRWGVAGAAAYAYEAQYSTIKNSNIYVSVPSDMLLRAWDDIYAPSNTADNMYAVAQYVTNTLIIENTNAYFHSEYEGARLLFAGGFEMTVQDWDGYVEVSNANELSLFGNADMDIRLTDNITIDFAGTPYVASVIDTYNSTFNGNGHTITINATHTDGAQSSFKTLIKVIGPDGVLTNATIVYNMIMTNNNVWSAALLTNTNNGTMSKLNVTINMGDHWIEGLAGYLSYDGTGAFEDIEVTLAGVHHSFLRASDAADRAEYSRAGIVNATGDAATVTNMTIHYGAYLTGITDENVLGLLAAGKGGQVNNIIASNVTAVA